MRWKFFYSIVSLILGAIPIMGANVTNSPEGKTINDVLGLIDGQNWQFKSEGYEVDLKLPRFEKETEVNLEPIMSALGMPTAFDAGAEFPYSTGAIFFIGQYMGNSSTGISPTIYDQNAGVPSTEIYNLSGRRLSTPPAKGIYIRDGKKVVALGR